MTDAAQAQEFERAAHWRERFDELTWLFGALARLRAAVEGLSFVYEVKAESGAGDDRVYLVRHGTIRAEAAQPRTPIEREAFAESVRRSMQGALPAPAARSGAEMQQLLLVMSWFRRYPEQYDQTSPYARWTGPA
jgi:excinuclease ABC subunit C